MIFPEAPGVVFMGDVHLGRRFIEGVPLDRRGEREEMVWKQFEHDLFSHNGDYHIQVGDLFDTFDVDNATVLRAARIYKQAAWNLSGCQFIILRGNHDASRSETRSSSFEVFKEMMEGVRNVRVLDTPTCIGPFGFLPWSPFKSAAELVHDLSVYKDIVKLPSLTFVVCHCDTKAWGDSNFNVLPLDQLKALTSTVITGHEHNKRTFKSNGMTVHVTGSMQPYSHGEDPEHTMYWTGTAAEMALLPDTSNLYLRVVLAPGEEAPPVPNCLGYKTIQGQPADDEAPDIEVAFEDFDTLQIFQGVLKELEVAPQFASQVIDKFTESFNDQNT